MPGPIMKFQDRPDNRECLHHTIRMIGVENCPYCGAPSLDEVERQRRATRFFRLWTALAAWLGALTLFDIIRLFWRR